MGKISVIIPCHNYGTYLSEAIESVLQQTRPPDEVIVVDDASTDITEQIARKYSNIIYIKNNYNQGTVATLNLGVATATGDYVMSLDADNRLRPDYLAKTSAILDDYPKVAIVYTDMALFGPYAKTIYDSQPAWQSGWNQEFYLWKVPEFKRGRLYLGNYIHGSALFRKSAYMQAGGYQEGYAEDWRLWKKIVRLGWQAKRVPEYLLEYRQHSPIQRNLRLRSPLMQWLKLKVKIILAKLKLF